MYFRIALSAICHGVAIHFDTSKTHVVSHVLAAFASISFGFLYGPTWSEDWTSYSPVRMMFMHRHQAIRPPPYAPWHGSIDLDPLDSRVLKLFSPCYCNFNNFTTFTLWKLWAGGKLDRSMMNRCQVYVSDGGLIECHLAMYCHRRFVSKGLTDQSKSTCVTQKSHLKSNQSIDLIWSNISSVFFNSHMLPFAHVGLVISDLTRQASCYSQCLMADLQDGIWTVPFCMNLKRHCFIALLLINYSNMNLDKIGFGSVQPQTFAWDADWASSLENFRTLLGWSRWICWSDV